MRNLIRQIGMAGLLATASSVAFAGNFTQSPDPAMVAAGASVNVDFLFAGDGTTQEAQLDLNYNATVFTTVTATALVPGSTCAVNPAPPFIRIIPPSGAGTPLTSTATTYCRFAFTAAGGAAAGDYDFTTRLIECDGGACTRTGTFRITVTGGGSPVGPSITYNPAAGAAAGTGGPVNFTGVTTPGSTGNGTISATPAGGSGGGTTTVGSFTLSGANAANFAVTSAATLTFTAGNNTAQNITMTCTSTGAAQTANLQATETITGGATSQRFWVLNCPAGAAGATPPTITYVPAPGATINVASAANTVIQVGCPTDGAACNGSGTGLAATARLEALTATYNGPPFSPTPTMLCVFVNEAGAVLPGTTLDFVPAAADSGDIRCTCPVAFAPEPFTVSVAERIPASSGTTTAVRTFNIVCGAGLVCPTLTAAPSSGTISLVNGGAAGLVTTYTVSGIQAGATQAINCVQSGATAGSTFTVTTNPSPLILTSTTTSGTVSATCTNTNLTTATATLTCTPAPSAPGCTPAVNTFTLSCPGGVAPPEVSIIPVPAMGEQGRILLAALMLLLGLAVVGFRVRN